MVLSQLSSQNGPTLLLGLLWYILRRYFGTSDTPSLDFKFDLEGQMPVQVMVTLAAQEAYLLFGTVLVRELTLLQGRYPVSRPLILDFTLKVK